MITWMLMVFALLNIFPCVESLVRVQRRVKEKSEGFAMFFSWFGSTITMFSLIVTGSVVFAFWNTDTALIKLGTGSYLLLGIQAGACALLSLFTMEEKKKYLISEWGWTVYALLGCFDLMVALGCLMSYSLIH